MAPWFPAFGAALALSLVAVPVLRRVATASSFVDIPDRRKVHRAPIPYLGGVALIMAVLVGILFEGNVTPSAAVLVLAAALLGTMGLIDDDHHVEPLTRLAAEIAAAGVAVVVGLRIHVTGVVVLDVALTVVWIVGVTNAFNLLDNMDGLAAGVAGVAATAVFALAVLGDQPVVATLAASTMGACYGFLAYNRPPATIFMGDTGSLFLGFVLAVLTVDLNLNPLGPPFSFAVPLMLLALPVLDTTTVTLARMRRGKAVSEGGKDHLSHRLVARGFSAKGAVGSLVAVEAVVGVLGVLAGRRVVPLWLSVMIAVVVIAAVAAVALPAPVYTEPVTGLPRKLKLTLALGVVTAPCLAAPAVVSMIRAADPTRAAVSHAEQALAALARGDADVQPSFDAARRSFAEARAELDGLLPSIALAIPGVSANLEAARTVAEIGFDLSSRGAAFAALERSPEVLGADGRLALDEVQRLAPIVRETADALARAQRRMGAVERGFLVPPLDDRVTDLRTHIDAVAGGVTRAAAGLEMLPALLGNDGPRRFFVAYQDSSQVRGSGGFIGNWAELTAERGRVEVTRFGTLQELADAYDPASGAALPEDFQRRWSDVDRRGQWHVANASPDFPTTAGVIAELYEHSGGSALDGVIAIDTEGIASLLQVTGPVVVPDWPEPITTANVLDISMRQSHVRFPDEARRRDFLGEVARRVTVAALSADLRSVPSLARALGTSAAHEHILMQLDDGGAVPLLSTLGVSGAIPPLGGDLVGVVTQDLTARATGGSVHRSLTYAISLDPSRSPARVQGTVDVELSNGEPGPQASESRTYVSVYGPLVQAGGNVDGRPVPVLSERDLGMPVHSATLTVPAGSTRTLSLPISGNVRLSPDGWYRVDLPHQPTVVADEVHVSIRLPTGWKAAEARGASVVEDRLVAVDLEQNEDRSVWVRVERTGWGRLIDRLMGQN